MTIFVPHQPRPYEVQLLKSVEPRQLQDLARRISSQTKIPVRYRAMFNLSWGVNFAKVRLR